MESKTRALVMAVRLMQGERLSKRALMAEFDVQEATIRRDIAAIDAVFATHQLALARTHLGEYWLDQESSAVGDSLGSARLSDEEITAIIMILLSVRGLAKTDLMGMMTKLEAQAHERDTIGPLVANDAFMYQGVAHASILDKLKLVCTAVTQGDGLAFDYTRDGLTQHFERWPTGVFYSDLNFYVVTGDNAAADDPMRGHYNRFRITAMSGFEYLPRKRQSYASRFQPGKVHEETALPYLGHTITLVLEYRGDPEYVSDRFPNTKVVWRIGNLSRLEVQVNDGYGVRMWLLGQAGLAHVVSPQRIKRYVMSAMQEALDWYATGEPAPARPSYGEALDETDER